jgi:RNA polymerase sigma-70 factor (ECF subfamily)
MERTTSKVTDLAMTAAEGPAAVAARGDVPSFETIFRQEAGYVGRTLRYLGVPDRSLEDACQEVFVIVHRRLGQLRDASARAWVRQICVHVARNHRRTARRRLEDVVAEPPEVAVPSAQEGEVERREARARLLALLDVLPEDQRTVFVLYEIEQLEMPEIAEAVGCALQTAYSRLYAARTKVQKATRGVAR